MAATSDDDETVSTASSTARAAAASDEARLPLSSIFEFLPAQALAACASVSRAWSEPEASADAWRARSREDFNTIPSGIRTRQRYFTYKKRKEEAENRRAEAMGIRMVSHPPLINTVDDDPEEGHRLRCTFGLAAVAAEHERKGRLIARACEAFMSDFPGLSDSD